jgi:hypothetical protein
VLALSVDIIMLSAKHLLCLVEHPVGYPHYLIKGDVLRGSKKGVPMDELRLLHNVVTSNH